MSTETMVYTRHKSWVMSIITGLALLVAAVAIAAWLQTFRQIRIAQPLLVTACTPDSYEAPAGRARGPAQVECESWFAARGDTWPASDPITVEGQVCNTGPVPVAYRVEVAWEAVDTLDRAVVLSVPITYEVGCQEPYSFDFVFPMDLSTGAFEGETLGRWRIVGRAVPVDQSRFSTYQWDAIETVEIIAD